MPTYRYQRCEYLLPFFNNHNISQYQKQTNKTSLVVFNSFCFLFNSVLFIDFLLRSTALSLDVLLTMVAISDSNDTRNARADHWIYLLYGLLICLTATTIALAAAILGIVVNRLDSKDTTTVDNSRPLSFVDQINIDELMKHLEQLQVIADRNDGTRAIATRGFNQTLDYITTQLRQYTNLSVQHWYFTVRNYIIQGTPQLQSQINETTTNHVYLTDFTHILFSSRANFTSFVPVVAIPNLGCQDSDWTSASATNLVALVKRGNCSFVEKSALAENYQVRALLIYNDGTTPDGLEPLQGVRNNMNTTIPAFFLSYNLGMQLFHAVGNASVMMNIDVSDANGIGNICADTPTGDSTKTIVIGAHSDGVPAGSGINDNGKKLCMAL